MNPLGATSASLGLRAMPPPRRHSNADLRRREEFGKLREIGSDMWVDGGGVTYQVCEWDLACGVR